MITEERIVNEVAAALEREASVNLHRFPLYLEFANGVLTMVGEAEHIMAKKGRWRWLLLSTESPGSPTGSALSPRQRWRMGRFATTSALPCLPKPRLPPAPCGLPSRESRKWCVKRIDVEVTDGVVVLNGAVTSLSAKRLAGVLAWWVPGSRDVVNGLEVSPPQEDNDDEVVDAIRLVLEKDPFVNAAQIRVSCRNYIVTLEGLVKSEAQRQMAEADAWYVFRVDWVVNLLQTEK